MGVASSEFRGVLIARSGNGPTNIPGDGFPKDCDKKIS
ncbi:predicted protein [Sclerotinia sclerotiorum 1980 UF-70]|uniref:Uncharacterized protein n=1 Tax=Sclerotinia sclerotiorum (strain ATCC 18683 / 1980 / Ss-1) TaxID=665079 RepID=A7EGV3_SCLS1|nr:predicted protein [Sclerotinia sclerotiorum 1980 UF-70]EDO02069.1 predicted protein [Sclerotinia sclerotiorum 1980 UF-70]